MLVLQPLFPAERATDEVGYWACWHALLPTLLDRVGQHAILRVFSPLADSLVAQARPQVRLVVYDCMDDLASFNDGSAAMRAHETRLLALADLVFTGGASMYEARRERHPRVFCFPSGVDIDHYRQRPAVTPAAGGAVAMLAALPRPRLGYFGVLDERIDWALIAEVAQRRPAWHWTLIGPTAKGDPAELPRSTNIHYLGQQAYAELPALLQQFDIATMPFALNEATRFISPTKTLEYLAGGKPVISSSVPDVVAFYPEIVTIADGAPAWIAAIKQALADPPEVLQERLARATPVLAASSWDAIATAMAGLIAEQLVERLTMLR